MYKNSIIEVAQNIEIENASVLVTGATGLIGSCLIDILIQCNTKFGKNITIYALSRSYNKIIDRFGNDVIPVVQDISVPIDNDLQLDYIIHGASNAEPRMYALQPVETILTNIIGTKNILEYCSRHINTKVILMSTFEVYGEIKGKSLYTEDMSGAIDQNILRNGYPESKRCSELLLKSDVEEYKVQAVIARLPSVYGPTMLPGDSKAHAQFIRNAVNGENIILKSKGSQRRTYCYVLDVVRAIFKILLSGNNGEIYNVSFEKSIASIAEVAQLCANIAGTTVIWESPDAVEAKGFSKSKDCILDNHKLRNLGWEGKYTLERGLKETYEYLIMKL